MGAEANVTPSVAPITTPTARPRRTERQTVAEAKIVSPFRQSVANTYPFLAERCLLLPICSGNATFKITLTKCRRVGIADDKEVLRSKVAASPVG